MNIVMKVSLHDNLGNEFSHSLVDTSVIIPKLAFQEGNEVSLGTNLSLSLNLPRETSNILSVKLNDAVSVKYNKDFVKLAVSKSSEKFPTAKIFSVGDIICFDSPLVSVANWGTSDESILRIDKNTGIGLIRASQSNSKASEQISVSNGHSRNGFIKYDLEAREADSIEFYQINDVFNGKNYKAHLVIKNHLQFEKPSNLIARNSTKCLASLDSFREKFFDCALKLVSPAHINSADVLDLLSIAPIFDKQFGSYACEIDLKPKITISNVVNLVKSDELRFEIEATLLNGISSTKIIKMLPAIDVYPLEIAVEQIEEQSITVTGLDRILKKIQVSISNPGVFEIIPTTKSQDSKQYKIKLLKRLPSDESVFVIINSPLTMQTIQIPIQSLKAPLKCLNQPFQSISTTIFSIISNLGLVIFMLFILAATIWGKCFFSTLFQKYC